MIEENKVEMVKQKCENHEKCMEMIQAVVDGSATDEEMAHFKNNMESCMPCLEGYELEKSIKETLQIKLEKKCCPDKTITEIKASLGFAVVLIGFVVLEVKLVHTLF